MSSTGDRRPGEREGTGLRSHAVADDAARVTTEPESGINADFIHLSRHL